MYHTNKLNQAPIQKNLNSTRFSRKDSQFEGKILQILHRFIGRPTFKLRNKYLAEQAGCCTKTVTRITNKLQKDGLITKHQENRYAPNHFTLTKKMKNGAHDYLQWINSLSFRNQDLFVSHGIRIDHKNKTIFSLSNVPQDKSINLILDNLFINLSPSSRRRERDTRVFKKNNNLERRNVVKLKPEIKKLGIYAPWKAPEKNSIEEERIRLRHEIQSCEMKLANPEKYFAYCLKESIKITEKRLVAYLEELIELERSSNEKQRIPNQYSSNSMAACTA